MEDGPNKVLPTMYRIIFQREYQLAKVTWGNSDNIRIIIIYILLEIYISYVKNSHN